MSVKERDMTCRQVAELTTDLLEGALGDETRMLAEAHLGGCSECRHFLEQVQATSELAALVEPPQPSESLVNQLIGLLGEQVVSNIDCEWIDDSRSALYLADRLSDDEQIAVFEHLVAGCEVCARKCRDMGLPDLTNRVPMRRELRERETGSSEEALFRELIVGGEISDRDSLPLGIDTEHFVLWLIRSAREQLTVVPAEASRLSDLAIQASRSLSDEIRSRAAMLRGHVVRRVHADYREAERWFRQAEALLGTDDATCQLLQAKLMRVEAHARFSQSRASEALELFQRAEQIYLGLDELSRFGECLIDKAAVVGELRGPEHAIQLCLEGSTIISWSLFPRYGMSVSQNLALYYADAGKCGRALLALNLARARMKQLGEFPVDESHLDWTAGRILNADRRFEAATEVLEKARDEFISAGLASKMAWVSLDLSVSLAELRRFDRLQEIAEPLIAYFVSRRLPAEALAAVSLFREAVVSRTVAAVQVRSLAELLTRQETVGVNGTSKALRSSS